MFKTWQIFVFSLVPLALVFTGVIIGSYHGSDSTKEIFPTPPPAAASSSSSTSSSSSGSTATGGAGPLTLVAKNLAFDKRSLTVPAGQPVQITLDNQDSGVLHNFSVYTNNRATTKIFVGDLDTGPGKANYTFPAPAAGSYFFRCDVHPDQMTGTFSVK